MTHPPRRVRGPWGCTRGASIIEYVLLVGAVALFALGVYRVFGDLLKEKIQGQSDAVHNVDGQPVGNQGSNAPGKSVEGSEGPGQGPAKAANADNSEKSVTADDDGKKVGTKARTDGLPEGTRRADDDAEAPARGWHFNYGWILAVAGLIVFTAVMFKGKRMTKGGAPS